MGQMIFFMFENLLKDLKNKESLSFVMTLTFDLDLILKVKGHAVQCKWSHVSIHIIVKTIMLETFKGNNYAYGSLDPFS